MNIEATTATPFRTDTKSLQRSGLVLLLAAIALWIPLVLKLRTDWSTNAQYEFGFFVPVFIAFLLFLRWKDRPAPSSQDNALPIYSAGALLLFALLPLRIFQEANPDWRPLNWVYSALVVTLTLLLTCSYGGKAWVRHFWPPFVLLFVALPWPLAIEQSVIQSLSRAVSGVTTEMLNALGISATQAGNVIHVPTGPVGVEDACSGIRSLAGTLMASVFFGEFYRFTFARRTLLVVGGLVVALCLNFVRAFLLSWVAATRGLGAIANWHDQAGLLIFLLAFGVLWFGAELLGNSSPVAAASATPSQSSPMRRGRAIWFAVIVWIFVVELGTELWYRHGEANLPHALSWTPTWPAEGPGFRLMKVSDEARSILRYTEGVSAQLSDASSQWQIFYLRWEPGRASAQLASMHRPEICLPATGFKYLRPGEPLALQVHGMVVPFECSIFDHDARPLYVFRTLTDDRPTPERLAGQTFDQSFRGRLQSAWTGRRNLGQKLLQIGIFGPPTEMAAREDLMARLPHLIKATPPEASRS